MLFKQLETILEQVQKPARYIGGEQNAVIKDPAQVNVRFAFCFPDVYEIGMSHLGMKILYSLQNAQEDVWCERVFAPGADMERLMREKDIPLYGLESLEPIRDFDIIGFTLQYEMCYPTVLNMLDLAGLPVRAADRVDLAPLVVAGGPCVCNPEPMAEFIDVFLLGEGEELNLELIDLVRCAKVDGWDKPRLLREVAQIPGAYVPSLYRVDYHPDGTVAAIIPTDGAPKTVTKRTVSDLDNIYFPESFVVPNIEIVHDRAILEVLRGCLRGCRFCQAGFIYRPFREKTHDVLNKNARALCDSTGYDEISLTSLSTSDLQELEPLIDGLLSWTEQERINIALPSLRIDNFSPELAEKIAKVRKSGLTFAPEAGTQRMRDVINKNITEEEVLRTCRAAFASGYTSVKLYFMLGLPTETMEDVAGIADLAQKVVNEFYHMPDRPKGKGVNVTISAACFVPKPFTPFEFEPQDSMELFREKQKHLKNSITTKKISYRYHDSETSVLEAVLARGDRRVGEVVYAAWRNGATLDGWEDYFDMTRWMDAFAENGIDPAFYANRRREYDEVMPWSHLDYGVTRAFLVKENQRAHSETTTPNCRESCSGCGAGRLCNGVSLCR